MGLMHDTYSYREQNQIADLLSKRGIVSITGKYHFAAFAQGRVMNAGSITSTRTCLEGAVKGLSKRQK